MAELGFFESLALGMVAGDTVTRDWPRLAAQAGAVRRQRQQGAMIEDLAAELLAENEALRAELAVLNDYIDRYKQWAEGEIARLERR